MQRGALILDIMVLWLLRPPVLADVSTEGFWVRVRARIVQDLGLSLFWLVGLAALWFSIVVATLPDEWQQTKLPLLDPPLWRITDEEDKDKTKQVSVHDLVFAGDVDPTTRRRKSLFSNTLVLPGFNIYEALRIDDPKKLVWRKHLFDLRGRHLEQAVFEGADLSKVDLTGGWLEDAVLSDAKLEGASFDGAHLSGAQLNRVRLQGVNLIFAELQSASLGGADLQGTNLDFAQLQGANLGQANLQGASLAGAQLQGASLTEANLQGASLVNANLQAAALSGAYLQGASFLGAQLQGVSLKNATIQATSFENALLWRTNWDGVMLGTVQLDENHDRWRPVWRKEEGSDPAQWDAKAYEELWNLLDSVLNDEEVEEVRERLKILDCSNNDKKSFSCEPGPSRESAGWEKKLELRVRVNNDADFENALAAELRDLVCADDANAIYILRGTIMNYEPSSHGPGDDTGRLASTGTAAHALVDFIVSKKCPVSASLTDEDKAKLLKIKQDAEQKSAPPPASKKEK